MKISRSAPPASLSVTRAPWLSRWWSSGSRWYLTLALVLVVGFLVRLPLVAKDLHASTDLHEFMLWARNAHEHGLAGIYDRTSANYGPLSVYLFAGAAFVEAHLPGVLRGDAALIVLIKLPSVLADVLTAALIAWAVRRRSRGLALPTLAAGAYLFSPATWYVSSYWGQNDSVYTLLIVAAVIALERGAVAPAWLAYTGALGVKVTAVFFAPLLLVWSLVKHGWRATAWGVGWASAAAAALCAPWLIGGTFGTLVHHAYPGLGTQAPRVDVSAYNGWYLLLLGRVHTRSSLDHVPVLGLTFKQLGIALFALFAALVLALSLRRLRGVALPAAVLGLGMFMLLTQMHERGVFPVAALVLLAAGGESCGRALWWAYGLISLTLFFNLATVASFAPSLWTNLVAAAADSPGMICLKALALAAAAINLCVLAWLVVDLRRGQDSAAPPAAAARRRFTR